MTIIDQITTRIAMSREEDKIFSFENLCSSLLARSNVSFMSAHLNKGDEQKAVAALLVVMQVSFAVGYLVRKEEENASNSAHPHIQTE